MKHLWLWCGVWLATGLAGQTAVKKEAIPTPGSAYRLVELPAWETGTAPRPAAYRELAPAAPNWRPATPATPAPASGNFLLGGARATTVAPAAASGYEHVPAAPAASGNFLLGGRGLPAGEKLPAAYANSPHVGTSALGLPPAAPAYAAPAPVPAPRFAPAPTARAGTVDFVMGGGPGPAASSYSAAAVAAPAYSAPAYVAPTTAPAYSAPAAPAQTSGFITGGRGAAMPAKHAGTLVTPSGGVRLFLAPFHNATTDEHAGRAMTELTATALLDRGINLIQTEAVLARSRQENAAGPDGLYLDVARSIQATHLLIGTVHEYRFKTDLDGSPAVGITVRLVAAADGATLWQGTVAKSSRFFGSLSRVALGAAREMAVKVPLDVVRP